MELEKLREDVYFELKDRGCSIGIFEVFTYNTLSRGPHPMMRAYVCKRINVTREGARSKKCV